MPFVTDPNQLANAWNMSRALRCRASSLYNLEGFEAYAFDSAVIRWGTAFEAALSEAVRDKKDVGAAERAQNAVLRRWIPSQRRYQDPAKR